MASTSLRRHRTKRLEHFELLVADDVRIERVGRLHADEREQLQQMVLHHVAQRARRLVVSRPGADAFFFRHGNLHVVDLLLVEQRLEDAVREAQDQDVLNGLFSEVVIDPVYLALGEYLRRWRR